jgi:hypothetical protein
MAPKVAVYLMSFITLGIFYCAIAIRVWRNSLRVWHILEHRVYRAGAIELRHRAAHLAGEI